MGGVPLLALSVAALPEELPTEMVRAIFDGADAQVRAAGAILAGGHTIRDAEPKYGLAVVGTVAPDGIWPKSGALAGDALYLTKPLGTALVLGGAKRGLVGLDDAVRWMRTLNRDAADVLRKFTPNAVTDVTGFGLLGHLHNMARESGLAAEVDATAVPAITGVEALLDGEGGVSGGSRRNAEYADGFTSFSSGVPAWRRRLLADATTSGGLLVAVTPGASSGVPGPVVGRLVRGEPGTISVL
jgi:selenide,water dikinase